MQRYVCAHCEVRPPRGDYMVHAEVWAKAGMQRRGFLCLGCLETRLVVAGHGPLQLEDFTNAPCNASLYFGYGMATRAAATGGPHRFKVGERVRFNLGGRWVTGRVVRDIGMVGVKGRQLVRVEVPLDPPFSQQFEVPGTLLTRAPSKAVATRAARRQQRA